MPVRPETDALIEYLNELVRLDRKAVQSLICTRVPCNAALAGHPFVQVHVVAMCATVGLLGVLNGFCGTIEEERLKGYGPIMAVYGDEGKLLRFARSETVTLVPG